MARPRKGEELGASVQIGVRVPPGLRTALDELARQNGRSITEEVRAALEEYARRKGRAGRKVVPAEGAVASLD